MKQNYSTTLAQIIKECNLETIYTHCDEKDILIRSMDINRPGMAFNGYYEFFDPDRIQIIGHSERSFLYSLPEDLREQRLREFVSYSPVFAFSLFHNQSFCFAVFQVLL